MFQTKIRVPFLDSHLRYQFQAFATISEKWNLFVQMVHTIPGRTVPIVTMQFMVFVYHLPKP